MRGHIRKRGSTWSVVVELDPDPVTMKRRQKWFGGYKRKSDAEKALTEIISKINKGEFVEPSKQTLADYLQYWLENYAKSKVAPRTFEWYHDIIRLHIVPKIGQLPLTSIRPVHLQELYTNAMKPKEEGGSGLSPTSTSYIHKVIFTSLKQAVRWQLLYHNPAENVEPPKVKKQPGNTLTVEQAKQILEEVKDDACFLPIYIALTTGMRRGEICGLKWSDIDWNNNTISVMRSVQRIKGELSEQPVKTDKSNRSVAMSEQLAAVLKAYKKMQAQNKLTLGPAYKDSDYICVWGDGKQITPDWITHKFGKVVKKLGFSVRFHDLRHTHATMLLQLGVHPKVVQERLGHSQIKITLDTYSHVLPQLQHEAAEKLDKLLL